MGAHLDVGDRDRQRVGHLELAHLLHEAQLQDVAVRRRQRVDPGAHLGRLLGAHQLVFRGRPLAVVHRQRAGVVDRHRAIQPAPPLGAEVGQRRRGGDPVEPRAVAGLAAEPLAVAVGEEQRLLRHVPRVLLAHDATGDGAHEPSI
ncbi:MAG: hypothetical protein JNK64_27140 [Myxococcales bacterium]|nr:hypothetical protein [Myxococcales bacterium]